MKKEKINEIIFGVHPIIELLRAKKRKIITLYTTKPEPVAFKVISKLLPKRPINIQYVKREILNKLAGVSDHQSLVALVSPLTIRSKFFHPDKQKFLLMLDGIQDVRNLGAILRSAYCTGVDGIILTRKNSAPLNASVFKASAGLAEHLEIYIANSAKQAAVELKNAGYKLYLTLIKGRDATKVQFQQPLCLVIGNEATGISSDILRLGEHVALPQVEADISYNASVASGIFLFLISTQNKII